VIILSFLERATI